MKPTVYIETSVIGYLTSWPSGDLIVAARQKITRDWWRDAPAKYDLVTSEGVVREANSGNAQEIQDCLAALQGLPRQAATTEAANLVDALLAQGGVPTNKPEGATHIAIAAVHGIQYLVTWNFKHIANAPMRLKINEICAAAGRTAPILCSPEELNMWEDPIVAEIRKIRNEHAAKFNYDVAAIFEDIRRQEKESGRQYVSYPPRRINAAADPAVPGPTEGTKECAG